MSDDLLPGHVREAGHHEVLQGFRSFIGVPVVNELLSAYAINSTERFIYYRKSSLNVRFLLTHSVDAGESELSCHFYFHTTLREVLHGGRVRPGRRWRSPAPGSSTPSTQRRLNRINFCSSSIYFFHVIKNRLLSIIYRAIHRVRIDFLVPREKKHQCHLCVKTFQTNSLLQVNLHLSYFFLRCVERSLLPRVEIRSTTHVHL